MAMSMWIASFAFAVMFQVIHSSGGCIPEEPCPPGTFIDDVLCCCIPCPVGTYNNETNQYMCKPCDTAFQTGYKTCKPWSLDCEPTRSWCVGSCKPVCNRGTYYDLKEKRCLSCPHGTFQFRRGTGCCIVKKCPPGRVPGPPRFGGAFPPLCILPPQTPEPASMCYSNCSCKKTQGVRVPLTEPSGMFNSHIMYEKENYSSCNNVQYELPCSKGAVVIVQELELGAGDTLQIDGANITGPKTIDLPQVFCLPPEDMNFTFTTDCCDEGRGFKVSYICMDKESRDFIKETGLATDCMIRDCLKNDTFAKYLLRIGSGEHGLLEEPITCPLSLLIGRIRLPVKNCTSCTPKCLDMGNEPVQECPNVYDKFRANHSGRFCV